MCRPSDTLIRTCAHCPPGRAQPEFLDRRRHHRIRSSSAVPPVRHPFTSTPYMVDASGRSSPRRSLLTTGPPTFCGTATNQSDTLLPLLAASYRVGRKGINRTEPAGSSMFSPLSSPTNRPARHPFTSRRGISRSVGRALSLSHSDSLPSDFHRPVVFTTGRPSDTLLPALGTSSYRGGLRFVGRVPRTCHISLHQPARPTPSTLY